MDQILPPVDHRLAQRLVVPASGVVARCALIQRVGPHHALLRLGVGFIEHRLERDPLVQQRLSPVQIDRDLGVLLQNLFAIANPTEDLVSMEAGGLIQ